MSQFSHSLPPEDYRKPWGFHTVKNENTGSNVLSNWFCFSWVWTIGKIVLWKRYLVLCLENFLCYILEQVSRIVLPAVGFPLYKFNLRIQPVKDLGICSAYFFFETSYELHMPRSSTAWIHRLNLLSENPSQTCNNIRVILCTLSYFFFTSSIITYSHVSNVSLYLELVSSVYPDENHWTVVRLRLDLPPGASLVPSNRCVLT